MVTQLDSHRVMHVEVWCGPQRNAEGGAAAVGVIPPCLQSEAGAAALPHGSYCKLPAQGVLSCRAQHVFTAMPLTIDRIPRLECLASCRTSRGTFQSRSVCEEGWHSWGRAMLVCSQAPCNCRAQACASSSARQSRAAHTFFSASACKQ